MQSKTIQGADADKMIQILKDLGVEDTENLRRIKVPAGWDCALNQDLGLVSASNAVCKKKMSSLAAKMLKWCWNAPEPPPAYAKASAGKPVEP